MDKEISINGTNKAKSIDHGGWVEGYYAEMGRGENKKYYIIQNGALPQLFKNPDQNMYFIDVEVDHNTLCRHAIGNLWENDIVEYEGKKGIVRLGEYDNKHYGFYIDWQQDDLLRKDILFWADKVKAIGNVFNDADLLRGDGDGGTKTGR